MEIHNVTIKDEDYPLSMLLVDKREQYDLISIDGLIVVPLCQVIDTLMSVKPDVIVRKGKKVCPNCGANMEAVNSETR